MPTYTLPDLERHWVAASRSFGTDLPECQAVFDQIPKTGSSVANSLESRKMLAENCAYLALVKALNHALSTYVLLKQGLLVDAALTARNGLETCLLLELLCLQPATCESWSQGQEIRPSAVRRKLANLPTIDTGSVSISPAEDEYADAKLAYDWLSKITHANLESLNHASTRVASDSWVLHVGGNRFPGQANAITKILGLSFLRAAVTCAAVHAPQLLNSDRARFLRLRQCVAALPPKSGA